MIYQAFECPQKKGVW